MKKYILRYKKRNAMLLLTIIVWAALNVLSSVSLTWLLDALIQGQWNKFLMWGLLNILFWLMYSGTQAFRDNQKEKLIQLEINGIREDILEPITEMNYVEFKEKSKAEYSSWLINDMNMLADNGFSQFYGAIESIVTIAFNAFAIVYFHWTLLVASICLTVFVYYSPRLFEKKVSDLTKKVSNQMNNVMDVVTDSVNGYEVYYRIGQQARFREKIMKSFKETIPLKVKLTTMSSVANSSSMMASIISQVLMFIVTGYLIIDGKITTGVIFSIANLTSCLFNYTRGAAYNIVTMRATFTLLNKYPGRRNDVKKQVMEDFSKEIELKNLKVAFKNGKEIKFPNIVIKKGEKIAIIGDSGSGKSTLTQCILGDIVSYTGEILMDGKNYKELDISELQKLFSVVTQKPYIFRETLYENITLGRNVDKKKLESALNKSCADEFAKSRLDEMFDDNLSGGQRARLSIARELVEERPVLIFDEGTASLNRETAVKVENNVLTNDAQTVIVITHHMYEETKSLFDRIVKIESESKAG